MIHKPFVCTLKPVAWEKLGKRKEEGLPHLPPTPFQVIFLNGFQYVYRNERRNCMTKASLDVVFQA